MEFGASTSFRNSVVVLPPLPELRERLLDPGALIAVRTDDWEDPVGVKGLIVNRVNHCSALGLIERFLKLKW